MLCRHVYYRNNSIWTQELYYSKYLSMMHVYRFFEHNYIVPATRLGLTEDSHTKGVITASAHLIYTIIPT